jgi:FkbM family methyltransferase
VTAREDRSAFEILQDAYFSEHPHEEDILVQLPALLAGCRHFVDIGASLGQYVYHASRVMRGGRIDAFEADPARAEKLKQSCIEWAARSGNRIEPHPWAVARTAGTVTFHTTHSNVSGGLFPNALEHLDEETRARVSWTEVDVPAISLDEFYARSTPDFIKMDIEGAEGEALMGATDLLRRRRTRWLIELHGFEGGWQPQRVIDFMRSAGYDARELASDRVLFTPVRMAVHWARALRARATGVLARARDVTRRARNAARR